MPRHPAAVERAFSLLQAVVAAGRADRACASSGAGSACPVRRCPGSWARLADLGMVERTARSPRGARLAHLATLQLSMAVLRRSCATSLRPLLSELAELHPESVTLAVDDGDAVLYLVTAGRGQCCARSRRACRASPVPRRRVRPGADGHMGRPTASTRTWPARSGGVPRLTRLTDEAARCGSGSTDIRRRRPRLDHSRSTTTRSTGSGHGRDRGRTGNAIASGRLLRPGVPPQRRRASPTSPTRCSPRSPADGPGTPRSLTPRTRHALRP